MRKLFYAAAAVLLLACCGCSHSYVIRMTNGRQIVTATKPKLKGNAYYWKDANGQVQSMSEGRVREILPASMAKEEKPLFNPSKQ
jgi:hypothetical protein